MNYRPLTDVWILARPKVKYYGAYPAGFLHRAMILLGVGPSGKVLHVCAGKVRDYPYRGMGVFHRTLDLDPATEPDYLQDAREPFPKPPSLFVRTPPDDGWDAILIDPPYTGEDAERYVPGGEVLPTANELLRNGIAAVLPGHRVGMLHYLWPQPPKNAKEVAVVAVGCGRNQRARWFTVFERDGVSA